MKGLESFVQQLPPDPFVAILRLAEWVKGQRYAVPAPTTDDYIKAKALFKSFVSRYDIPVDIAEALRMTNPGESVAVIADIITLHRELLLTANIDIAVEDLLNNYESGAGLDSFGVAKLNEEEKRRITNNIDAIRVAVDQSQITDRKKNALHKKLDELAAELNRIGTRTDQFFAFMGDVAFVMGDMATKAKPLLDEVKDMIKTVSRARARQEGVSLPPGDSPLSLPAPEEE
jgi:hypothetical protein